MAILPVAGTDLTLRYDIRSSWSRYTETVTGNSDTETYRMLQQGFALGAAF
jgi:hypothetical protein